MLKGRKGVEHSLWTIIEIALLVIVIISMFAFVRSVKENLFFERSVLSKDTALLMDAVQSVPGDLFYSYTHDGIDMTKYSFKFAGTEVAVSDGVLKNTYIYYDTTSLINSYDEVKQKEQVQFMKTATELKISESVSQEFGRKACGKAQAGKAVGIVYIVYTDPRLGPAADALKQMLSLQQVSATTYDKDSALNAPTFDPDLTIVLSFGDEPNSAVVHYSTAESSKLACQISNRILDAADWASYVATRQDQGNKFLDNKFAVELKVGDKNTDVTNIDLASPIQFGLKKYEESKDE